MRHSSEQNFPASHTHQQLLWMVGRGKRHTVPWISSQTSLRSAAMDSGRKARCDESRWFNLAAQGWLAAYNSLFIIGATVRSAYARAVVRSSCMLAFAWLQPPCGPAARGAKLQADAILLWERWCSSARAQNGNKQINKNVRERAIVSVVIAN
jgi:hypothetical protein